jgi:hypothetical protein
VALREKESRKRDKYQERIQVSGTFTPLVCSVFGTLTSDSAKTLQQVVRGLKDEQPEKKQMISMQRVYLQTAIIKASSMCLRCRAGPLLPDAVSFPDRLSDCRGAAAEAFDVH